MKKRYKSTFANVIVIIYAVAVTIRFPLYMIFGVELDKFGAVLLTLPWSFCLGFMIKHIVPSVGIWFAIFLSLVINAYIIRRICKLLDL